MYRNFSICLIVFIINSLNNQSQAQIKSNEFLIQQDCPSSTFIAKSYLSFYPEDSIKLFNYQSNLDSLILSLNGQVLSKEDTIFYYPESKYVLQIESKIPIQQESRVIRFDTDDDNNESIELPIKFGHYYISNRQIRNLETTLIKTKNICQDSFTIVFPYGGTQTDIILYDEDDLLQGKSKYRISYMFGFPDNSLKFPKNNKACYVSRLLSCHWAGTFEIKIE